MTGSANTTFEKADLQGAEGARFIAAGAGNTIVIDTDGNTRTCGIKGFGQLGRNTENTENPELFKVTDGIGSTKMMAAAAGNRHSILLDEGGGLWSCGGNQNGQLCRNGDLKKSETFAAVTEGMIRTITFDEMKNTVITSDRVFTVTSAVREKVQLEYDLGGGNWVDGFTPRDFAYKDEELVLPDASNVKKTGYTFAGWETSSLTADPIKCSAKWTANTYTVTFDGNGGTVAQETMQVTYGEPLDQMPIPRYKGYFFLGWYDRKWGGRQYSDKYGHSTTRYDKAEDCTLYAMWEEAPLCTVTFDPNGGTLTGAATCVEKQNECIREPSLDEWPVREGHNFLGWYTDAACKPEQKWDFDDPIPGNMTLYAGWEILSYVIRVRPENGKPDILIDQNYDTAVTPPTLTRVGYIFAGWDTPFPEKMPAKILTITARWTVCDHSGHTGANPTCTTSVICTACGGTIAALGHDFSVEQHDENTHWKKCSRCEAKNDENPHDWDNGKVTVKPTCMTKGERIYTCDECGATKNEPIQASGHSWDQAWQHNAAHHWHECLNADCDVKNNDSAKDGYGAHTGGTAACTAEAICEYCHQSYGEKDPSNHVGGTQEWTTRTAYVHEQKWSCCGAVIVASEDHEWSNGVCSECGYACLHDDADKNHICDICSKVISNHEDADKNHVCDFCEKIISNHEDADNNHVCDYCDKAISNHEDADKDHVCDYCDKAISNHEDADKDHICDYCKKIISNHDDADKNHICDYCEKIISNHEDADKDHVCDFCDKVISNHIGGTATCHTKAICEICRNGYGEFDETKHDGGTVIRDAVTVTCTENGYTGDIYCAGCDELLERGNVIEADGHTGGRATCTEKAVCDICGKSYGETDPDGHGKLVHIDAKAATEDSEGNIEYWHCEVCGKYYADAEASQEIAEADTVTKKLTPKTADITPAKDASDVKAPGTGDTTSAVMATALLMSAMAAAASVFSGKKKKHSER